MVIQMSSLERILYLHSNIVFFFHVLTGGVPSVGIAESFEVRLMHGHISLNENRKLRSGTMVQWLSFVNAMLVVGLQEYS